MKRRNFIRNAALTTGALSLQAIDGISGPVDSSENFETISFPQDFMLGVSSSAYQIEGAHDVDGKGESIWDRFSNLPGMVEVSGNTACDHYHRYKEDIELLKKLGVNTYRFSVSWPRIFPDGDGKPNLKGMAFYKDLVKRLIEANIKPCLTLYHWDLPQKLQDRGGWANRETADHFANYAAYVFKELGNDVDIWTTHNEPWVTAFSGYARGGKAPGIRDFHTAIAVTHNLLLSHGKAVKIFRQMGLQGQIGITLDLQPSVPAIDTLENRNATDLDNDAHHAWFADPIFTGKYPENVIELYKRKGVRLPEIQDGDMEIISTPIDYLGLNYYNVYKKVYDPSQSSWPYETRSFDPEESRKFKLSHNGDPDGLYNLLLKLHERYNGVKIIITENGKWNDDYINAKGEINDDDRIEYIYKHMKACRDAIDKGVNLKGYIIWSFLDDYEWNSYGRMGLVYVNYKTMERIIKKSGYWYSDCIRQNKFTLGI